MPKDLPLPIAEDNGTLLPATATEVDRTGVDGVPLIAYDPWTHANLALMADHSQPTVGEYGEADYPLVGSIVGEWGGMPSPVRDYQDMGQGAVLYVRRIPGMHLNQGVTGAFYGPQQTAWEASYTDPTTDYWSVILGQD